MLPYLPGDARERLPRLVSELSAAGSRFAIGAVSLGWREQSARIRTRLGLTMDMDSTTYNDEKRIDIWQTLSAQGWQVRMTTSDEQRRQLGRPLPADLAEASVTSDLFTAERANGGE